VKLTTDEVVQVLTAGGVRVDFASACSDGYVRAGSVVIDCARNTWIVDGEEHAVLGRRALLGLRSYIKARQTPINRWP